MTELEIQAKYIYYSSEIWGLWCDESLPYSWNMKTQIVFPPFHFELDGANMTNFAVYF